MKRRENSPFTRLARVFGLVERSSADYFSDYIMTRERLDNCFEKVILFLVLAILVYRIRETFDSMDVSRLSRLKG